MAHESWWVRKFQLLPLHNPLLTLCKFFLTICFCFRFQPVKLVLELIFEAVRTLVRIVVLLQQLIRGLHQIISMAHDGWESISTSSSPISHYWRSVNFTVILTILFFFLQISASCVNPRANCWCGWVLCQPCWSTPTTCAERFGPFVLQDNLLPLPMTPRTKSHLLMLRNRTSEVFDFKKTYLVRVIPLSPPLPFIICNLCYSK